MHSKRGAATTPMDTLPTTVRQCVANLWDDNYSSCINFLINGHGEPAAVFFDESKNSQRLFKELEDSINADIALLLHADENKFDAILDFHMREVFAAMLAKNRPTFSKGAEPIDAIATEMATRFTACAFQLVHELARDEAQDIPPLNVNEECKREFESLKIKLESEALKKAEGDIDKARYYMNVHVSVLFELYTSPEFPAFLMEEADESDEEADDGQQMVDNNEGDEFLMDREDMDAKSMFLTEDDMAVIQKALSSMNPSTRKMKTKVADQVASSSSSTTKRPKH